MDLEEDIFKIKKINKQLKIKNLKFKISFQN